MVILALSIFVVMALCVHIAVKGVERLESMIRDYEERDCR